MKITDFDIRINKENVFMLIDCYPDSPVYETVTEEFEEILPEAYKKLSPAAVLEFGNVGEYDFTEYGDNIEEALFCIESVGGEMSLWVTSFFDEGNYLKGMLADAIADDCLFQIDNMLRETVIEMCRERNFGVLGRLEAPQDIPMEFQKIAWKVTNAKEEIGLDILESYMLDPVKSNCQVYILKKDSDEYKTEHDCSKCPRIDCKMRNLQKFQVTVKQREKDFIIEGKERQTMMEILQNTGIYLNAVCAGKGTCGKCKVRFLEGVPVEVKEDKQFFCKEELEAGYRLACKAVPNQTCTISLGEEDEKGFVIVSDCALDLHSKYEKDKEQCACQGKYHYGLAVDIGTTTIAMQLVELESSMVLDTYTAINRQRAYGADVISRIKASNEGKAEILRRSILEDLEQGIKKIIEDRDVQVEHMVISGNTIMIHLLMGYPCETLGIYPFTPVNVETIETNYREMFHDEKFSFDIKVFPGISTYVGGDIVAGLFACGFAESEKISMLIDLGTNGEMAIGSKDKILVTSTAAGPAFEGGNITCGTGSIPGAISKVVRKGEEFKTETIGEEVPTGICGTGVIDITYELLKNGLIDETGLLDEDYFEAGIRIAQTKEKDIRFYQKDIREIQLAKAAVRAGIETLLVNYGATYEDIDTIYIAGGFGYKIDIQKAIGIGLLPKECEKKIKAVGNSSLKGSLLYLTEKETKNGVVQIVGQAEEVQLSMSREFNNFYMEYMYF